MGGYHIYIYIYLCTHFIWMHTLLSIIVMHEISTYTVCIYTRTYIHIYICKYTMKGLNGYLYHFEVYLSDESNTTAIWGHLAS